MHCIENAPSENNFETRVISSAMLPRFYCEHLLLRLQFAFSILDNLLFFLEAKFVIFGSVFGVKMPTEIRLYSLTNDTTS